jgi:hypothetical protein
MVNAHRCWYINQKVGLAPKPEVEIAEAPTRAVVNLRAVKGPEKAEKVKMVDHITLEVFAGLRFKRILRDSWYIFVFNWMIFV